MSQMPRGHGYRIGLNEPSGTRRATAAQPIVDKMEYYYLVFARAQPINMSIKMPAATPPPTVAHLPRPAGRADHCLCGSHAPACSLMLLTPALLPQMLVMHSPCGQNVNHLVALIRARHDVTAPPMRQLLCVPLGIVACQEQNSRNSESAIGDFPDHTKGEAGSPLLQDLPRIGVIDLLQNAIAQG